MLHAPLLLAFAAAATLFAITPGIDTALVLRTAAINARAALFAALGICLGCLCWGTAASLGLGAVLRASALAYAAVKWTGAAYLVWVGARLLLKPRQALGADTVSVQSNAAASLRRGFLTNILNPKVGVFYITFLPQFVPHGAPVATTSILLAAIHVAISFAWFCALVAAIAPLGRFLRKPSVVRTLDRLTGGVFIAFGVKLAVARG